jgi:murein peptide amidase A
MCDPLVPTPAPAGAEIHRLGKNINGYLGETIDIASVLSDCTAAAQRHGWTIQEIPAHPKSGLLAYTRLAGPDQGEAKPFVYLSTGIHGDEPAGPLAARQLLQENDWPPALSLVLCPCLNPTGFRLHRRENDEGTDLNRQYLQPKAEETRAHIDWLSRQPAFDLCICLHEDWESSGFYLYELNPDGLTSLAPSIIESVARVCPIDNSEIIEGRPAQGGIISPSVDPRTRPLWPEAFYLLTHNTRLSYTFEAPSDFALPVRVAALVQAVRAALSGLLEASSPNKT